MFKKISPGDLMNIWLGPLCGVQALLLVARPEGPSGIWTRAVGTVAFLCSWSVRGSGMALGRAVELLGQCDLESGYCPGLMTGPSGAGQ